MIHTDMHVAKRGVITPISVTELSEISARYSEFSSAGLEEIRSGHVGAVLLAGGMGTRLGSDSPKGMFNIGLTRELYIFECLINNLMDVTRRAGNFIHLFVMTSDRNHDDTVDFFARRNASVTIRNSFISLFRIWLRLPTLMVKSILKRKAKYLPRQTAMAVGTHQCRSAECLIL